MLLSTIKTLNIIITALTLIVGMCMLYNIINLLLIISNYLTK